MNLSASLKDYLSLRRSLGFKMKDAGRELPNFVAFLNRQGIQFIMTKLALQWAARPETATQRYHAQRLSMARGFAKYLSGIDPRTEIPPPGALPYGNQRRIPYIYTEGEIRRLLTTTRATNWARRSAADTYATLFGLLAVTGMRLSECLNLDDGDVDLAEGVLTIRGSKWRKSRLVPIHATTVQKLAMYQRARNLLHLKRTCPSFFILGMGNRPKVNNAELAFLRVARRIGLRGPTGTKGPYLHDLRHTFAVGTLRRWYRAGVDVERHLPELSTYLGHSHVAYTYWYLSAEPELLHLAATRIDNVKGVGLHEQSH